MRQAESALVHPEEEVGSGPPAPPSLPSPPARPVDSSDLLGLLDGALGLHPHGERHTTLSSAVLRTALAGALEAQLESLVAIEGLALTLVLVLALALALTLTLSQP